MTNPTFFLALALPLMAALCASADIVEHTFNVQNFTTHRLCEDRVITGVNGRLPGPTILVREGDTLIVHVINTSPYNITIHWHGIFQKLTAWYDGPEYVTQCPIRPGHKYTYRFTITEQEGTLWWHAHVQWLRANVYGSLIIRPRFGRAYPFPKPYKEVPIILGEYWNANVYDVEAEALAKGGLPNISDAFTINGQPGDLYPCSSKNTYRLTVVPGRTYLLRIINAAVNSNMFFKIANHKMTVVAVDASYTNPYVTDVVVLGTGQTTDVLLTADQKPDRYYMAARAYSSARGLIFDTTTTTGIMIYKGSRRKKPLMPVLPAFNDTPTAHKFFSNITGLVTAPFWVPVPQQVDEHMFITISLGYSSCPLPGNQTCLGPFGFRFSSSMNNASFELPTKLSMLEAFAGNVDGIYTTDFPDNPPMVFDYNNPNNNLNLSLAMTGKSTKVRKFRYNSTVEIVFQNTNLLAAENHPMHVHGFNFHVLAMGFGNYNPATDRAKFNLVNPHIRNTVAVPVGGWAVIRFQANNPGVWMVHCHLDVHVELGFATAFVVENGPTQATRLPLPPPDLPKC